MELAREKGLVNLLLRSGLSRDILGGARECFQAVTHAMKPKQGLYEQLIASRLW